MAISFNDPVGSGRRQSRKARELIDHALNVATSAQITAVHSRTSSAALDLARARSELLTRCGADSSRVVRPKDESESEDS